MEWSIVVTEKFEKYLSRIDRRIAARIVREVDVLRENPFRGKVLRGLLIRIEGNVFRVYSLRVGDYRVIYTVNPLEKKVYLLLVGHRSWIYREAEKFFRD